MKKALIVISILIILALAAYLLPYKQVDPMDNTDTTDLLLRKEASWGPCMEEGTCNEEIEIYNSGKARIERGGGEPQDMSLSQEEIFSLKELISSSGIMDKNCTGGIVNDYSATYEFYLNGKEKKVTFPACEQELIEVDELLGEIFNF